MNRALKTRVSLAESGCKGTKVRCNLAASGDAEYGKWQTVINALRWIYPRMCRLLKIQVIMQLSPLSLLVLQIENNHNAGDLLIHSATMIHRDI